MAAWKQEKQFIKIRGAGKNNPQRPERIDIPRNEFVVLTGLSGSGKTLWHFDTIYAEEPAALHGKSVFLCAAVPGTDGEAERGEHRGLSPAISIDQVLKQKSAFYGGHRDGDL